MALFGPAALGSAQTDTIAGVRMRAHLPQTYDASGYSLFSDPFEQLPGDTNAVSKLESGRILGEFDNDLLVLNEDRLVIYYRADQFNHPMLIDDQVSDFTIVYEPASARDRLYVILTDGSIYEYFEGGGSGSAAPGGGGPGGGAPGGGGGAPAGGGGGAPGGGGSGVDAEPGADPKDPEPTPLGEPISVHFKSKLVHLPIKGLKYFAPEYGPIAIAYGSDDGCLWAVDSTLNNATTQLCPGSMFTSTSVPLEVARLDWDNDSKLEYAQRWDDHITIYERVSNVLVPIWTESSQPAGSYADDQIFTVKGSGSDRDLLAWTYDAGGAHWLANFHSQLRFEPHQPLGSTPVADLGSGDVRGESAPGVPDGKDDLLISFAGGASVRVYQRGQSTTYTLAEDTSPGQSNFPFSDLTGSPAGIVLGAGDLDRDGDEDVFFGRSFDSGSRETLVTVQLDGRVDRNLFNPKVNVFTYAIGAENFLVFLIDDQKTTPAELHPDLLGKTGLKLKVELWDHADAASAFDTATVGSGQVGLDAWMAGTSTGLTYVLVPIAGVEVTQDLALSFTMRIVQEVAGAQLDAFPPVTGVMGLDVPTVFGWSTVLEHLGDWLGPGEHKLNVPVLSGTPTQGSRCKGSSGPPPLK